MTRITVQQIRSPIRRPYDQRLTLIGLKLNKIGRIVELPDTPQARGMITKVAHLLRTIGQETELDCFTRAVRAKYQDLITTRIRRGEVLWSQFEAAVEACRADPKGDDRQSTEKVNEMAVAKALLDDQAIPWPMTYEPDLLPDGRKIDFVVDRGADNLYIEVKTVRPRTADTDAAWEKFLARRRRHPENVNVILEKDWMGGVIYGNLFASRSHFLDFTVDFEVRLAAAQAIKPGHGILIFCGTGFAWHKSNVEDFADFYLTGRHRGDDPFALMEQHHIEEEKNQAAAQYRSFCIFAPPYRRAEQGGIPLSRSRPAFFLAPPKPLETVAS